MLYLESIKVNFVLEPGINNLNDNILLFAGTNANVPNYYVLTQQQ